MTDKPRALRQPFFCVVFPRCDGANVGKRLWKCGKLTNFAGKFVVIYWIAGSMSLPAAIADNMQPKNYITKKSSC